MYKVGSILGFIDIILSCKIEMHLLSIYLSFSLIYSIYFQFLYYTTRSVYSPSKCVGPKFPQICQGVVLYLSQGKERCNMLGPRIAALRRSAGLSQGELARRLQISASAVGMYEQGRREPSAQLLVAMARQFGVTTDYLLTGKVSSEQEEAVAHQALLDTLRTADQRLEKRDKRPFSREELAVLMTAMLLEA